MDKIFKTFRAEIKDFDDETGEVNLFIPLSSAEWDRDKEVVEPASIRKYLPKFMKHPVLVASHDYRDLTNLIGEWKKVKVTEDGTEGKPRYYIGMGNEQADWAYKLAKMGVAAFSYGFIPIEWEDGDGIKTPRRTYKEIELLEISQVIIPSNRQAIMEMRSKSVDPVINELLDEVEKSDFITKPEETDDFIHIPVKDADQFQPDSFRTIDIDKGQGISAVIGKLKGETKTTVQKYMFDKSKGWTMAHAQEWVRKHGKSAIYQCVICAKCFIDSPSAYRKVCSTKCGYKHLSQLNSGENHPQWKGGKSQSVCEQCGDVFETHRRGNNQRYCSIDCHNKAMEIDKEKGTCPVCSKEFIFYPSNPQIYCSRECFYEGNKEFLANYNKTHSLTEAQEEALGKGRLNGFGGYSVEAGDGHLVQSAFEKMFDDWLYQNKIEHNIQIRVSPDRYWTCDFVLIRNDGETLWVECDGLGKVRPKKFQFEEKLNYYKSSGFHFLTIGKTNESESKEEIKQWVKEHEGKEFNPDDKEEIVLKKNADDLQEERKSVIPYHKYDLDERGDWDAAKEVTEAEVDDLKKMCTIVVGDPDNKTSYKLPHHRADGYTTVWRAVANCAAVLMGARGGVDAPEADIAGAKRHIGRHYDDFGRGEPPWERTVSQASVIDEIDYLKSLITSGLNMEALKSFNELVKSVWGELGKMDMGKIQEMHDMMAACETMANKSKQLAEDMMSDTEEEKRVPGYDKPVDRKKDIGDFNIDDILKEIQEIKLGG